MLESTENVVKAEEEKNVLSGIFFFSNNTSIKIFLLNPFPKSPGFYVSVVQVFWKHCGKRGKCSWRDISPFPTLFSTRFENFVPLSSNLKLSSSNSFSLEESKICCLGKDLRVCLTSLLKTLWEKEKLLVTSNFSFSHSVFYPFRELFTIFINFKIVICKLFHFGRVQNLSFGKGLKVVKILDSVVND